jgi:hypothetical protein
VELEYDIFISHSSEDKNIASNICHYLEEREIRCWIAPRDVQGGMEYAEAIINGIRACKVMVVVFNKNANQSKFVKNEVERAFTYSSNIIPFRLDETLPSSTLELFLGSVHWLDAIKGKPEDYFDLLYQNCARSLGKTVDSSNNLNPQNISSKDVEKTGIQITDQNSPMYFYEISGESAGPVSMEELKQKKITKETRVWKEGMEDWIPAVQVTELIQLFGPAPPPLTTMNTKSPPDLNKNQNNQLADRSVSEIFDSTGVISKIDGEVRILYNVPIERHIEKQTYYLIRLLITEEQASKKGLIYIPTPELKALKVNLHNTTNKWIRIKGSGLNNQDLYIKIETVKNKDNLKDLNFNVLTERGNDFYVNLLISKETARHHGFVSVPNLDGNSVNMVLPETVIDGKQFVLKGQGKSGIFSKGNLYVTIRFFD